MRFARTGTTATLLITALAATTGCVTEADVSGDPVIELDQHNLLEPPHWGEDNLHLGAGAITGTAIDQPIAFPHYTHVTTLGMECQYCHSVARRSIHAGVPPTQTCMGCHQYVKTEQPEIKKIAAAWENGEGNPIQWKKVHDLPDFVYFAHKPHIRAGVDCTECHGQVQLQGMPEKVRMPNEEGTEYVEKEIVANVFVRETTMQMGWCLNCHASHPSVDENYGDQADLRRAELKDCWTCHK